MAIKEEKENIGHLFDRIAGSYDMLNHLLSLNIDRYWRRKAVEGMCIREGKVLDVAIGTGDLAIELVRQQKAVSVQGIDLSQEMMVEGRKKVSQMPMANGKIVFNQASALDIPYEENSFDAVTCGYGVRNFSDLTQGLQEMYRVLKKDGELMILEFSYPTNCLIRWGYDLYFSYLLPLIGRMVSKDPTAYSYLNQSVKHFIWGEAMCERLREIGFRDVTYTPLTFGITTVYRAHK